MTRWALGIVLAWLLAATAAFPPGVGSQPMAPADSSAQRFVPKIVARDASGIGRQGSGVYLPGGVRTARHVIAGALTITVNGDPAQEVCADELTDSATLTGASGPPLDEDRTGMLSGELVLVAGWPHGKYFEVFVTVLAWARSVPVAGRMVGPVYILAWTGPGLEGISGGPVIRRGKVVATMVAQGTESLLSVPVSGSKCQMPAS